MSTNVTLPVQNGTAAATANATVTRLAVKPTASFTYKVHPGGTVEFDASGSTPADPTVPIAQYHWDFGDGKTLDTTRPVLVGADAHAYQDGTKTYTVTLTVKDSAANASDPISHDVDSCKPDYDAADAGEFSGLVACVEKALPDESPSQILMTVRQLYYGDADWTDPTKHTAFWLAVIPCVGNASVPDPTLALNGKLLARLRPAAAHAPLSGDDITHIFPVLDAMECPAGSAAGIVMPNYDIAGWGGDIGDAAVSYTHAVLVSGAPPGQATWNRYIGPTAGTAAPNDDLYGDIDGVAMHFALTGSPCSPSPAATGVPQALSTTMYDYFTGATTNRAARIACLRSFLGIDGLNREQAAQKYRSEIFSFALAFYVKTFGLPRPRALPHVIAQLSVNSREAMGQFFDWLSTAA